MSQASSKRVLLISNSTLYGSGYLDHAETEIRDFLGTISEVLFIPYALYDRDAYQAQLRQHTNQVSAIRYDVHWSAKNAGDTKLQLRLELRGLGEGNTPKFKTLEAEVTPGFFSQWTQLTLDGDEYRKFGAVTAWRATLWDGDRMVGEHKSFLW